MASPRAFDFGILLGLAYQTFVEELRAKLDGEGFDDLGSAYGYVFRALSATPIQLNQLARRLGITNQGASKIIDEMAARGYVVRRADPEDARARLLALAPRGESALAAARRFHAAYERKLAKRFGARAAAELRRVLEELVGALDDDDPRARLRLP
jgi:DNA-binding MarR family transcriptional regulator